MKKSRTNRGITLIALIITIIVMMILIGVTVAIALEGEIFETAGTAALGTEKYEIYDQILGAIKLRSNGNVNVAETYSAAKAILESQGRTVEPLQGDGTFEVTGKKGTYKYRITETKIEMSGVITENDSGGNEAGDEVVITAEKDLGATMYWYNTMYNREQADIVNVKGYFDDENNDRISDKNEFLGAYINDGSFFSIPKAFFEEAIPTQGNISATITHFDGTEENITLTTTDNKKWIYESQESQLTDVDRIYIGFRPFAQYNYDIGAEGIDRYEDSTQYHYMYIEGEVVVPFYKLKIFNKTIEFPYNCQAALMCGDLENEMFEPMYTNIDKVSKITVNFSNNTNKVYTKDNIFDLATYLGDYPYSSKERPILYADGQIVINMIDSSLQVQITSVIIEEDGIVTKYNVSESTDVIHMRPGS